jgi:hypothetical protein
MPGRGGGRLIDYTIGHSVCVWVFFPSGFVSMAFRHA